MTAFFFILFITLIQWPSEALSQSCVEPSFRPAVRQMIQSLSKDKNLKNALSSSEADALFHDLSKQPTFRMKDPGAYCYHRSQLIGKFLEDQGIYSEQLYIDCPSENLFASDPYSGKVYRYGDHWTNLISVTNPKTGKTEQMVFDPQFQTTPVSIDAYLKAVVQPGISFSPDLNPAASSTRDQQCHFRRVDRHSYQALRTQIEDENEKIQTAFGHFDEYGFTQKLSPETEKKMHEKMLPPIQWFDSRVRWDELEKEKSEIEGWNQMNSKATQNVSAISDSAAKALRKKAILEYLNAIEEQNEAFLKFSFIGMSDEETRKNKTAREKIYQDTKRAIQQQKKALLD